MIGLCVEISTKCPGFRQGLPLAAFVLLLSASLALAGCVDERRLTRTIETCPKAVARLGAPFQVVWARKIGSPGVLAPSVPGCTHKALLEGPKGSAALYFSVRDTDPCFHLFTPTGQVRDLGGGASEAVIAVTDVRACTEGIQ